MKKLNWNNLKYSKCPKCSKYLEFYENEEFLLCSIECGFMIDRNKMQDLISKVKMPEVRDNFSLLHSL